MDNDTGDISQIQNSEAASKQDLLIELAKKEILFEKIHRVGLFALLAGYLCLPALSDLWQDYWIFKALCYLAAGFFATVLFIIWVFSGRFFLKSKVFSGFFLMTASYCGISMGLLELFYRFDRDLKTFMPGSTWTIPSILVFPLLFLVAVILTGALVRFLIPFLMRR